MNTQEKIIDILISCELETVCNKIIENKDSLGTLIEMLINRGDIPRDSARNYFIRRRYKQLHVIEGMRVEDTFSIISKEFESICPETVRNVIYAAKK